MISRKEMALCSYYFVSLPLYSWTSTRHWMGKHLFRVLGPEIPLLRDGYVTLCSHLGKPAPESDIEEFVRRALWVKIVRESDAYTSLRISKKNLGRYFDVTGIEHLEEAIKKGRPAILLTGHIGSFFIPAIAFSHLGFRVYPLARSVDRSPATPFLMRLYQTLNYKFSEKRFSTKYIFTDFGGKIDRDILRVMKTKGSIWSAIDLPKVLFPANRVPVRFLGRPSSLPSGLVQWALKKNCVFLTSWNTVETDAHGRFLRKLRIDPPIGETDTQGILQAYADRLSATITKQPWQWMGITIVRQFDESEGHFNG